MGKITAKDFLSCFLGQQEDNHLEQGAKVSLAFFAFGGLDWALVAITQTIVASLLIFHWTEREIWLLLWTLWTVASIFIVIVSDKSKGDPTLMEGCRRLVDTLLQKSIFFGIIAELLYLLLHIIWSGPASFYIFFRKRFSTHLLLVFLFVVVAGLQMILWTKVYIFGYGIITAIWHVFYSI